MTTKQSFLLADRKVGKWAGSFSISANWIWTPALLLSSQLAYTHGLAGLFWWVVPNILALVVFAHFAKKIRTLYPFGFTLSGYMRDKHSKRVQVLYFWQLLALSICSFAVQLLGGGLIIAHLIGGSYLSVTVGLALFSLTIALWGGFKTTVKANQIQMGVILVTVLTLVPWVLVKAGGWSQVWGGLGGMTGEFRNPFGTSGFEVFLTMGVAYIVGLLSGPFGDQSFWQRAFSIKPKDVKSSFQIGAVWFAVVPLVLSLLGFSMSGNGHIIDEPQLTNLFAVMGYLPIWTLVLFVFMLLGGILSTLDSCMSAVASLAGHDVFSRYFKRVPNGLTLARLGMVIIAFLGVIIANLPGMTILYLSMFYGVLRSTTVLPTVLSLTYDYVSEKGVFYGILASFVIGLPLYVYGGLVNPYFHAVGSVVTVLLSGLITIIWTRREKGWSLLKTTNKI